VIEQLPLNIHWRDDATLQSFYPGDNQEALKAVSELSCGIDIDEPFLYLWGPPGVGRTHLLQAACRFVSEREKSAFYISLRDKNHLSLSALQGMENLALVCIDDVEEIAGLLIWEEALFHLFNRIQSQKGCLLIASAVPPKQLSFSLPDLKSRLNWGVTYQLHRLTDEQKVTVLQLRAQHRGLQLNKTVSQFLLSHCSRDMVELYSILEKLDRASLVEQRRLTIPFVKHVLDL
jgi:DnaA family protein